MFWGVPLAATAAALAWRWGWLTAGGAALAGGLGAVIVVGGGLAWAAATALAFGLTAGASAATSELRPGRGGGGQTRRTSSQVAGSCTVAALAALAYPLAGEPVTLQWAFAGALATVAGDTLSSDLVPLYRTSPESLGSGDAVSPGTPGAVSLEGFAVVVLAGGFVGGLLAAVLAVEGAVEMGVVSFPWALVPAAAAGGVTGSMADSLLGALGGRDALRSEVVNLLSSAVGAGAAGLLGWLVTSAGM